MYIGSVEINGYCALAPMAGVADIVFRELCKSYGAAYTVGEMVSAKGVTMDDRKSKELMLLSPKEHPCAIQIFGSEPKTMAEAAEYAMQFGPDIIDINMGCPAPKVTKNGCGSALSKKPVLAAEILSEVKKAVSVPVTAKIRTGWDFNSINCVEMAKRLEQAGADAITVHGRTREQMYSPPVDLSLIKAVKEAVSCPVIGNGDINSPESAKKMLTETGVDFLMAGRAAMGAPWIFSQINEYLSSGAYSPAPFPEDRLKVMLTHAEGICLRHGEKNGMREVRKHALSYTKGMPGSAAVRREMSTVETLAELKSIASRLVEFTR